MARLIPKVDPATIENPGERIVAQALVRELPHNCIVYHSCPWLRPQRHATTHVDYLQPGETDFVVVQPDKEVMILEVKGGTLEFRPRSHEWVRVETGQAIQDPFLQAEKNKYALLERIQAHPAIGNGPPPFTMGHAVAFPHSRFEGTLPANADRAILFDAGDVVDIGKALDRAFDAWRRVRSPQPLTPAQLDAITESLSPVFRLTPVLWRTIDDQEERLKRLTDGQARLLDMLRNQERAAIEGVAGSGKTILAISQAQRFARRGLRTLLVCYNRPLADWIQSEQPEQYRESLTVNTYHGLCADVCRRAQIPFPTSRRDQDFWTYEAPELLEQAAAVVAKEHGFDAIVVDEGQDFMDLWWIGLEELYRSGNGPLYVFYDPKQNIYVAKPSMPGDLGRPFVLPTNCRNTESIASFCGEIVGIDMDVLEGAPKGVAPRISEKQSQQDVIRHTRSVVQEWCLRERGGLQPRQVAILTPVDNHAAWPETFGNLPLVFDFDKWRENQGVLLSTHRRFKGLEADALVLAGPPEPGSKEFYSKADHYVACSRAKHLLEIVFDRSL